jgi:ribosomal protein L37AE/L43A
MLTPIVAMYMRAKYTSHHGVLENIPYRPYVFKTFIMNHFGVKWKVLYGTYLNLSEPYAFVDGDPLCPDCDYEMKAEQKGLLKKHYWKCERCGKSYKCPVKNPYDATKIVERLLESEIRRADRKVRHPPIQLTINGYGLPIASIQPCACSFEKRLFCVG